MSNDWFLACFLRHCCRSKVIDEHSRDNQHAKKDDHSFDGAQRRVKPKALVKNVTASVVIGPSEAKEKSLVLRIDPIDRVFLRVGACQVDERLDRHKEAKEDTVEEPSATTRQRVCCRTTFLNRIGRSKDRTKNRRNHVVTNRRTTRWNTSSCTIPTSILVIVKSFRKNY